jgi:hypothetical protein
VPQHHGALSLCVKRTSHRLAIGLAAPTPFGFHATALLALTETPWVLALALLSLVAAVAGLSAGIDAAFADDGEPDLEPAKVVAAPDERQGVVPPASRELRPAAPAEEQDRKAA